MALQKALAAAVEDQTLANNTAGLQPKRLHSLPQGAAKRALFRPFLLHGGAWQRGWIALWNRFTATFSRNSRSTPRGA
jgi:hypothetical protein